MLEVLAASGVDFSVICVSHLKDLEWLSLLIGSRYIEYYRMIYHDLSRCVICWSTTAVSGSGEWQSAASISFSCFAERESDVALFVPRWTKGYMWWVCKGAMVSCQVHLVFKWQNGSGTKFQWEDVTMILKLVTLHCHIKVPQYWPWVFSFHFSTGKLGICNEPGRQRGNLSNWCGVLQNRTVQPAVWHQIPHFASRVECGGTLMNIDDAI